METTPEPELLSFRPSARLQKYLGRELIADPNLAIIEFVKNAYDAGATRVLVEFFLEEDPARLVIADNGSGMSEDEFRENWMRPGFSHKAKDAPPAPAVRGPGARSPARQLERVRVPAGEKGLGRMAAGRLGARMDVFTRPSPQVPWFHVPFVWAAFDDMSIAMDSVKIAPDYTTEPPDGAYDAGTAIVISGLSQKWDGRVRGRPVRGRKRTKLGRLRQDLEHFVRPLKPDYGEFSIDLQSDRAAEPDDIGPITTRTAAEAAEYCYSFSFELRDGQAVVIRSILRGEEVASVAKRPRKESFPPSPVQVEDEDGAQTGAKLHCGSFHGTFFYSPPPVATRATDPLPMGVLLFRDGLWVEPYGIDDNDWLGIAARKAQRQGHAAIQPNTMTGFVEISRDRNPGLQDMSNRMGLLENEESEEFLYLARQEFHHFEQVVYEEVLEHRWEGNRAKEASKRAKGEVDAAGIFMASLAHSVRQPIEGLRVELGTLRRIAAGADIPEPVRQQLDSLAERATRHADQAAEFVQQALQFEIPEFSEASVADLLKAVRTNCAPLSESLGVELSVNVPSSGLHALVPWEFTELALTNIVANAIQAPRAAGTAAVVSVEAAESGGDWVVSVSDNGTGIPDYRAGQSLASVRSTSGRPGAGLRLAELTARASQGRLEVVETGPGGTVVSLSLPTRASGLKDDRM